MNYYVHVDQAQIDQLTQRFFSLFTNKDGRIPNLNHI